MLKKKTLIKLFLIGGLIAGSALAIDTREPELTAEDIDENDQEEIIMPKIYDLSRDANCGKKGDLIFCTDNDKKPITGEIQKYYLGNVDSIYPVKDGYVDGTMQIFHSNGEIKSEREYKKGKLDGVVKTYDHTGEFVSEVPYKENKKEGVAIFETKHTITKTIFVDDKANGQSITWDKDAKQILYNLKMANDTIISGVYNHYNPKDVRCCQPKEENVCNKNPKADCCSELPLIQADVPNLIIEGLNQKCLQKLNQLSCGSAAAIASGSDIQCNQAWRQDKDIRHQILTYFRQAK